MAEAHGNRTHQGSFSPPSTVLKTGSPTSDDCASPTSEVFMDTLSTGTSIGCCCWEGRTETFRIAAVSSSLETTAKRMVFIKKGVTALRRNPSNFLVGARRFELPTPCSRSRCATRLRYAPTEILCSGSKGFCQQENLPEPSSGNRSGPESGDDASGGDEKGV